MGCGNGQLEWKTVGPLIYRYASQIEIPVEMYAPYGTPPKLDQWTPIIEKTTDLFVRMNTDQAEIVAAVIFAADSLKKELRTAPSEIDVLNAVLEWKNRRNPPLDAPTIASAIRNLGLLHWLDVKPDANLPVGDEEFVSV